MGGGALGQRHPHVHAVGGGESPVVRVLVPTHIRGASDLFDPKLRLPQIELGAEGVLHDVEDRAAGRQVVHPPVRQVTIVEEG